MAEGYYSRRDNGWKQKKKAVKDDFTQRFPDSLFMENAKRFPIALGKMWVEYEPEKNKSEMAQTYFSHEGKRRLLICRAEQCVALDRDRVSLQRAEEMVKMKQALGDLKKKRRAYSRRGKAVPMDISRQIIDLEAATEDLLLQGSKVD